MNRAHILALDISWRRGFSYKPDPVNFDNWRDHSAEVQAGKPWEGDCDDATSTILTMLQRAGVPTSQLYRVRCLTQHGADDGIKTADHMIGAVVDDDGEVYVVGDVNLDAAQSASLCMYHPFDYQRLDEWVDPATPLMREGFPWTLKASAAP
jgi:hypothetical protein